MATVGIGWNEEIGYPAFSFPPVDGTVGSA